MKKKLKKRKIKCKNVEKTFFKTKKIKYKNKNN